MDAKTLGAMSAAPLMPPLDSSGDSARGYPYPESGLTKREAFAMAALQGLLANAEILRAHGLEAGSISLNAAEFADALLAELAKEQP